MVLAETVSIDGRILVLVVLLVFLAFAVGVAAIVGGFVLAPKAALGPGRAMTWWIVCLCVEGISVMGSIGALITGGLRPGSLLMPAVVAGQVVIYRRAQRQPR